MSPASENQERTLPPPWDRIFSLASRTFVWGLLIGMLYVLRPFLLLIFLTFVFAYIQAHGVDGLAHRIKRRWVRVTTVGLVFLGTLFATGFTLVPQIQEQAATVWSNRTKYVDDADVQLNKTMRHWGVYDAVAKHKNMPDLGKVLPPTKEGETPPAQPTATDPKQGEPQKGEQKPVEPPKGGEEKKNGAQEPGKELHVIGDLFSDLPAALNLIEWGQSVLGFAGAFLLSLLFSFLIVLDLPKLSRSIQGLSKTKIGFIYDEVADNIAGFGRVLGRALEAQLFIAVCNTILTAIGVWMMGLPNLLVLSTLVFFCSFIPVAGTFISSTPICLLALQAGGVTSMMLAIALICVIHTIETYILNPQIYGHHMHMNPVLVLIVLTIGGKLFGVWGLLLGIPVMNYVFRHAIRYGPEHDPQKVTPGAPAG